MNRDITRPGPFGPTQELASRIVRKPYKSERRTSISTSETNHTESRQHDEQDDREHGQSNDADRPPRGLPRLCLAMSRDAILNVIMSAFRAGARVRKPAL